MVLRIYKNITLTKSIFWTQAPVRAKGGKKRKRRSTKEQAPVVDDLSDVPPTFLDDVRELIDALEDNDGKF